MSKTTNTDNAWSETGENNNTDNFQDNKYSNERREDRNYERKEDSNYERNDDNNRGDDRKKYDNREDNMRGGRYMESRHDTGRFEERRRYEPREYDQRDERSRVRYFERRPSRFDDRRRLDSRGDNYPQRYDDRRYNDFRGGYRGGYDEGRYGGSMYNRPAEYGRRIDHGRMGGDGFNGSGYGMMPRRNNYSYRQVTRQDDAPPNLTIALFNLRRDTTNNEFENAIHNALADDILNGYSTKIILDRNTGKCRGFGFLTFESLDESIKAKGLLENLIILGNQIRVAFSIDDTHKKEIIKDEDKKPEMEEGELNKEKEEFIEKNDD